ncbi:unnamed protein product [Echinostoma caproni]|uniref:Elongator complex protein 3 n=1 Tax=Echinostoma caproni TaxID=27848 RepID=A0A183B5N1_9TREM|nr:unnamed protein product [Echinostoma caproni]
MKPKKAVPNVPKEQLMIMTISEIISELIKAVNEKRDVNLNKYVYSMIISMWVDSRQLSPVNMVYHLSPVWLMLSQPFPMNTNTYCPGGPDSDFEYSTQSYTGYEPTSMRAIRARYNPYMQTRHRIEQLQQLGHSCDKVEFIVMGGTFMCLPEDYRDYFIRNLHDALSGHSSQSVEEAVSYSERSRTKCVGITIETRPDYCLKKHLRGHTVRAVCESFHLSKDAGFKVVAHMMPDLPNVGWERDIAQFAEYFENPAFRSDGLKIYPTLVIRGTGLYELWRTGRYRSYPSTVLIDLVARILALVPPWTRVYRIQRDIPMPLVTSGVEHGNLRELVLARMAELGASCRDVRTREVGIQEIHSRVKPYQVGVDRIIGMIELIRRDYVANGGWETFLAYEDPYQDILIGLLRLRQCSSLTFRPELRVLSDNSSTVCDTDPRCSIVRELHVYGSAVPISAKDPTKFQHQVSSQYLYGIVLPNR